ncbi:MAG: hypothetical protein ACYTEZ_18770 [Planctomycetota bacterium]|jgi:hypothetical protein
MRAIATQSRARGNLGPKPFFGRPPAVARADWEKRQRVKALTGKPVATFQASHTGKRFAID